MTEKCYFSGGGVGGWGGWKEGMATYINNVLIKAKCEDWQRRRMDTLKGSRKRQKCFLPPLLSDHGKPYSLCYLSPSSAIRIVSACQSISKSKQDIVSLLHTCQFLSSKPKLIGTLYTAKPSPFSSFFCWCGGERGRGGGIFVALVLAMLLGVLSFPVALQTPLYCP